MPKVIQIRNFYSINDDEWRVLSSIETGMRNHEYVQLDMIHEYAGIRQGGKNFTKILRSSLIPHRLIAYENNGYRLTNLGYDFLALHKFLKSNIIYDLSNFQLFGTGKESDLYVCKAGEISHQEFGINSNHPIVLKFHRLGRTSFKQVKNKREYKSGNSCSWLYMNRISATREYCTMKALYDAKLPVPTPIGHNRGAVAMEYINSYPLFKFSKAVLENGAADILYNQAKYLIIRLAQLGLVHGDLNEFNLLVEVDGCDTMQQWESTTEDTTSSEEESDNEQSISENEDGEVEDDKIKGEDSGSDVESLDESEFEEKVVHDDQSINNLNHDYPYLEQSVDSFKLRMIDFPQVISRDNKIAQEIYTRDRHGIISFFKRFTTIDEADFPPEHLIDIERVEYVDVQIKAPGYQRRREEIESDKDVECIKSSEHVLTVDRVKKRVAIEKNKQTHRERIYRQQRNIKKKECRRDLRNDIF